MLNYFRVCTVTRGRIFCSINLRPFTTTTVQTKQQRHHHDKKLLMQGVPSFQSHLQHERIRYSQSPIILLTNHLPSSKSSSFASSQQQQQQPNEDDTTTHSSMKRSSKDASTRQRIEKTCQYVSFLLQQQMNLRTFVIQSNLSYDPYPSRNDLNRILEVADRIGATTLVAVGTGGILDLAKAATATAAATANNRSGRFENVLLIPATYNSLFVAATSHSIFFDPKEEVISLFPSTTTTTTTTTTTISTIPSTIIATLHDHHHHPMNEKENDSSLLLSNRKMKSTILPFGGSAPDVILVMISLLLSRYYTTLYPLKDSKNKKREDSDEEARMMMILSNLLQTGVTLLQRIKQQQREQNKDSMILHDDDKIVRYVWDVIYQHDIMSYGIKQQQEDGGGDNIRSIPLAIATSLVPKFLSQHHFMDILISIIPSLCQEMIHRMKSTTTTTATTANRHHHHPHDDDRKKIEFMEMIQKECSDRIPIVVTNEIMSNILSELHSNQINWNRHQHPPNGRCCYDISDTEFNHILQRNTMLTTTTTLTT
jgi:hypothetical protein